MSLVENGNCYVCIVCCIRQDKLDRQKRLDGQMCQFHSRKTQSSPPATLTIFTSSPHPPPPVTQPTQLPVRPQGARRAPRDLPAQFHGGGRLSLRVQHSTEPFPCAAGGGAHLCHRLLDYMHRTGHKSKSQGATLTRAPTLSKLG